VIVAVGPHHAASLTPESMAGQAAFFDSMLKTPQPIPVLFLDRPIPGERNHQYAPASQRPSIAVVRLTV
jgi:hypothetical protein